MARHTVPVQPPTNEPVELGSCSDRILLKFFFSDEQNVPPGIRKSERSSNVIMDAKHMLAARAANQSTERGTQRPDRFDDGKKNYDTSGVSALLLRTGLGNAEDHQWKLVDLTYWQQEVNGKPGVYQYVVQAAYARAPKDDEVIVLTRPVRDQLAILAGRYSWNVRIWTNEHDRPVTLNFTSPKSEEPLRQVVVRDGAITVVKISAPEQKAA